MYDDNELDDYLDELGIPTFTNDNTDLLLNEDDTNEKPNDTKIK